MSQSANSCDYPGVSRKLYIITGATGAIGQATSLLLARLGAYLALNGRNRDKLEHLKKELPGSGHLLCEGDLTSIQFRDWLQEIVEYTGIPLSGIAWCAGVNRLMPLRGFSVKKIMAEVNDFAAAASSLFFETSRLKQRAPECSLVIMSSISAAQGIPGNGLYGAARAAMESLCRSFAVEFASLNIRCNCVRAGFIADTGMTSHLVRVKGEAYLEYIDRAYPLGTGKATDAANAIAFLLGSASRWITGSILQVDGGYAVKGL